MMPKLFLRQWVDSLYQFIIFKKNLRVSISLSARNSFKGAFLPFNFSKYLGKITIYANKYWIYIILVIVFEISVSILTLQKFYFFKFKRN